ncbi:MAG: OprO/OprP family phosphate-selective porin [Bacteroidaceae bacterium]|nr:OprO/OprP family phosphate-selective porin [Bacteroidaceae bacterium]
MKRVVALFLVACIGTMGVYAEGGDAPASANDGTYQGPEVRKFSVESRFGWQMLRTDGAGTDGNRTGFRGEFFNLRLDARLYRGLTFSWRQRLNITSERNFWNSTDWMTLDYTHDDRWHFSAGKQIVAIGGYEYDRAPIDLYGVNSEFWNQIACYQFGVSASYSFSAADRLLLQFCNSPFRTFIGSNDTYGFSLMWNGSHGMWETIWSVNAFQCTGGRWMNYIVLGNKFNFLPGRLWLELDYINRASSRQTFLFDDSSVIAEMSARPLRSVRVFAKYNFDINRSGTDADLCVTDGTKIHGVSGGVEYEPFARHPEVLRLFGMAGYTWGVNANPDGAMFDGQVRLSIGAKLNLDILKGLRMALRKH